ncbi:MAG: hypothetical protein M3O01_11705, partial [Pseudomonadota bacterium]|nr:hypothetical protein [Pseudomonadota bacterium]
MSVDLPDARRARRAERVRSRVARRYTRWLERQAQKDRERLFYALVASLFFHFLIMILRFEDPGAGVPGIGVPSLDLRSEPVSVVLAPGLESPASPSPASAAASDPPPAASATPAQASISPAPPSALRDAAHTPPDTSGVPGLPVAAQGQAPPVPRHPTATAALAARAGQGAAHRSPLAIKPPSVSEPAPAELDTLPLLALTSPSDESIQVPLPRPEAADEVTNPAPMQASTIKARPLHPRTKAARPRVSVQNHAPSVRPPAPVEPASDDATAQAVLREAASKEAAQKEAAQKEAELEEAAQETARQEKSRQEAAREAAVREAARLEAAREQSARQEMARLDA